MGEGDMADPARGYTSASYALSGKIMLSAIVILFTVVLVIICLHIYARCFLIRARRRNNTLRRRTHRRSTTHLVFISDTAPSQSLTSVNNNPVFISRGLEPAVLKSLPTFIYSSTANKTTAQGDEEEEEVLECAVCLSEFEESEKGRLLPKCNHSFHIECIDMWFHTHSTCPICRAPVNNPQISEPEKTEIPSIQIVIDSSESEPTSSSSTEPCPSCQHEELIVNGVPSSSSSSSTSSSISSLNPSLSMGARRKISELVGVSIEVPRREESFREEIQSASPGSQGLKSPGSRILSLKRILSREKKPSIPSLSFCGSVSEIDPEKGVEVEEEEEEEEEAQSPAVQVNR